MASLGDWKIPAGAQPRAENYSYDLEAALSAVVGLHAIIPDDAFTAETLGTERAGNGVVIGERGLVLTIGYLVTEADSIWLRTIDGRALPGHPLAYDHETGFGLVQALGQLAVPALSFGSSRAVRVGEDVVVAGAGGRHHSVAARVVAKQEFAGYWEYVLDEAIFTAPAHPSWGGAALIGHAGDLLGIGSLQLEQRGERGAGEQVNMIVPIDPLKPILDDLVTTGRANRPARPWLGFYATEIEDKVIVVGVATGGPAQHADLRAGDMLLAVGETEVRDLIGLFRAMWACGPAGVEVPLTVYREGKSFALRVPSSERSRFLKTPRLH
jgi:S1-C subfamily serine protease